jgi:Common central domain of tyrosinase
VESEPARELLLPVLEPYAPILLRADPACGLWRSEPDAALLGLFQPCAARATYRIPPAVRCIEPFYVSQRRQGINESAVFSTSAVSNSPAFRVSNFLPRASSRLSFGGRVPGPAHFSSFTGLLEAQPHNTVHVQVGGDPNTAAQDSIFWLHHANIDRLWKRWLYWTCSQLLATLSKPFSTAAKSSEPAPQLMLSGTPFTASTSSKSPPPALIML